MADQQLKRRLAAIAVADVVGYSRLMESDEAGTLAILRERQKSVLNPIVRGHAGRIVKVMGDGVLMEFASAVNAVAAAIELQEKMARANIDLHEDRRILLRIGINLGDIISEGSDVYGDGVNIASRLETLAPPGGICISAKVHDELRGKGHHVFEDMGEVQLKNITNPVRAFRVVAGLLPVPVGHSSPRPEKPSIAVLPFANISGDADQEYFADGISEDIITSLSKLSQLFVIARNSSFTFKHRNVNVQEIGRTLGVSYLLEGAVRKSGNRVRITAQLVDATTGGHLWAERFDRDLTDIFAVQDDVTQQITDALALNLTEGDQRRLAVEPTDNVEAYDCFLHGRERIWRFTRTENTQGRELLQRSIELDPNFAPAYAFLAFANTLDYANQWTSSWLTALKQAEVFATRAVALDKAYPWAHWALGIVELYSRRHDVAIHHAKRLIVLAPNLAEGHENLGYALHYAGRSEEALACFDRAITLNPYYPNVHLHFQAQAMFQLHRYEEAITLLKRRLVRNPDTDVSRVLLAASYGHLGRVAKARQEWLEVFRINPEYSLEHRRAVLPYKNPDDFELIVDGLRKAGLI